jgi:hypothetical protein
VATGSERKVARKALPPVFAVAAILCVIGLWQPAHPQSLTLKPQIRGLISMGDVSFHRRGTPPDNSLAAVTARPGAFSAVVLNVTWAELQPAPGVVATDAIDRPLRDIRAWNARNPAAQLSAKLRVWPGIHAPDWVKSLGGPPVTITHQQSLFTVGRFWNDAYRRAWRSLQVQLAAKYDADPVVREVANTSCSAETDEPLNLPSARTDIAALLSAGYTDKAFTLCLTDSAADYADWRRTSVELTFNPYRRIESGRPQIDPEMTYQIMQIWRHALGPRAILSCHGLQSPPTAHLADIFADLARLGPPIEFQTRAPKFIDWNATIEYGRSLGASAIELWQKTAYGGFVDEPDSALLKWQNEMKSP